MLFKEIISKEGWVLRLHKEHEIFSIPIFQEFNFEESIPISYTDLYILAFNHNQYSLLSKEEITSHLTLLEKICYVNRQIDLLKYALNNFQEDIKEWGEFINPSIMENFPEYLLSFPEQIDTNLEIFSKLEDCDDLKREKLLEYAQNNNIESFTFLLNKSLINNKFLKQLFKYGKKFVEIIVDKGFDNWDYAMNIAALVGDQELIKFFIDKGCNDWNNGMYYAAQNGHEHLVLFFISKGANKWDWGMIGAAKGGYKHLVDFFINKGAIRWNEAMYYAAKGGHNELVDFFIGKGACTWNHGMDAAAKGGHKDLVEKFIDKGANQWDWGIYYAARGGNKEIVELFISKGPNYYDWGLQGAIHGGHKHLINFFKSKGISV